MVSGAARGQRQTRSRVNLPSLYFCAGSVAWSWELSTAQTALVPTHILPAERRLAFAACDVADDVLTRRHRPLDRWPLGDVDTAPLSPHTIRANAHNAEEVRSTVLPVELLRRVTGRRDPRGRTLEIIESTVVRWVRHLTQPKTREDERYLRLVRPMAPAELDRVNLCRSPRSRRAALSLGRCGAREHSAYRIAAPRRSREVRRQARSLKTREEARRPRAPQDDRRAVERDARPARRGTQRSRAWTQSDGGDRADERNERRPEQL